MVQRQAARWTIDNYSRQASVTEMMTHLGWRSLNREEMIVVFPDHTHLPFSKRTLTHWFIVRSIQE